ncbi:hypothetical protein OS493_022117 [Desmophyllum pertusum]|uniref:C-terminal of Roc (COR) domain-containing protein n=1 Tax=Desmophyllum pertusum TaxID=174260 RepID=A0A9W9YMC9_9CNID|nr:hypothetical protein OS493_022117 [Desmophyllum pertusum]
MPVAFDPSGNTSKEPVAFDPSGNTSKEPVASDPSGTTSKEPALAIDATSPPEDFTNQYWNYIRSRHVKSDIEKDESVVSVDLWDFAGQHLYYASHPVFFSSRAVYLLVCNLSKPLNATAQPCARQGIHDVFLENPNGETNLENLLSWLATVHSITQTRKETVESTEKKLSYLRPPVFIVGTHADKPFEDAAVMKSQIEKRISGKEYERHVIRPFFSIDNTRGHSHNTTSLRSRMMKLFRKGGGQQSGQGNTDMPKNDEIEALRNRIMEVLKQEPYMGEEIPIKWFNFERVIEALVAEHIYHVNLEQLQRYAREVCFIDDEDELTTLVNFYHDIGLIIKHCSTVVLKAQWLIDLFKQLITIPPFLKTEPVNSKYWLEVETTGVLSMELVDHVFYKFIQQGVVKKDILDMMEQFGLIAKFSPSPTDVKYFVPAQLKSSPESLCDVAPSSHDPCPMYVHFVVGFVPHGLFSQLVSRAISWCSKTGPTQPPNLYLNGAWFVIGSQVIHDFILICKKSFIKIVLKLRNQDEAVLMSTLADAARSVRLFVEGTLQDLSQELPGLNGLRYKLCVTCPYCLQESHKCANHNQPSCAHEDCLHFLEMKHGERLICKRRFCDKLLTVRGLEKWFPQRTSQV